MRSRHTSPKGDHSTTSHSPSLYYYQDNKNGPSTCTSSDDDEGGGDDWCVNDVYDDDDGLSLEHGLAPPTLAVIGGDESLLPPHPKDRRNSKRRRHRRRSNSNLNGSMALPGRPIRRIKSPRSRKKRLARASAGGGSSLTFSSWYDQLYDFLWNNNTNTNNNDPTSSSSSIGTLCFAVMLWYILGVVSISTSKILLTPSKHHVNSPRYYYHVGGVPPLVLTAQQLFLGRTLLKFLLNINFLNSPGLQSWESYSTSSSQQQQQQLQHETNINGYTHRKQSLKRPPSDFDSIMNIIFFDNNNNNDNPSQNIKNHHYIIPCRHLLIAGIAFTIGFLATNLAFNGTTASFVETIKAAEPISSAFLAVSWGLESLTGKEIASLGSIVAGVVLSTIGNTSSSTSTSSGGGSSGDNSEIGHGHHHHHHISAPNNEIVYSAWISCCIVLVSNLCFSCRGLYQKLFRKDGGYADDLNLQYRMQQIGVMILIVPTLFWNGPSILRHIFHLFINIGFLTSLRRVCFKYCWLAIVNGVAFTSYNLASTYILSRITVVHHAALNCVRRIFAIVVTSIVFRVPITLIGSIGIILSFVGFMVFTYAKTTKQQQQQQQHHKKQDGDDNRTPLSSLLPLPMGNGDNEMNGDSHRA